MCVMLDKFGGMENMDLQNGSETSVEYARLCSICGDRCRSSIFVDALDAI